MMVSVLIAPAIVKLTIGDYASDAARYGIAAAAVVVIVIAVAIAKRRPIAMSDHDDPSGDAVPQEPARA